MNKGHGRVASSTSAGGLLRPQRVQAQTKTPLVSPEGNLLVMCAVRHGGSLATSHKAALGAGTVSGLLPYAGTGSRELAVCFIVTHYSD